MNRRRQWERALAKADPDAATRLILVPLNICDSDGNIVNQVTWWVTPADREALERLSHITFDIAAASADPPEGGD